METPEKIKIIKKDAILAVNISTHFYLRCKAIASYLIDGKSNKEMTEAYEKIKNEKIDEPWIQHLETILVLCAEFDKQANETNNLEELTKEEFEKLIAPETGDQK
jgi:hypothetical protein